VRAPPRLRGGLGLRLAVLLVGLLLFAAGIVALLESRLGLSPWDVLHLGLAKHTPLSFGEANIAVSVFVLTAAWLLGARVGVGTVANAVLVGAFVQLLSSLDAIAGLAEQPLSGRAGLLLLGLLLMGAGTGLYLGADLGAGPRDSLMVVGARRTRFRIGLVRAALELGALIVGALLGGTIGVGTVAFAIAIGPSVEASFWLLAKSPLVDSDFRPPHAAGPRRRAREPRACCTRAWERG
jgi:uncharacterized membrane protein YczE